MKSLKLEGDHKTPYINFDYEKGYIEIAGRSIHENTFQFFKPIITWINEYINKPKTPVTQLIIKLEYYNSSSSKFLLEILQAFDKLASKGHPVQFKWYYAINDEDVEETGRDLASFLKHIKTEFVSYERGKK